MKTKQEKRSSNTTDDGRIPVMTRIKPEALDKLRTAAAGERRSVSSQLALIIDCWFDGKSRKAEVAR